MQNLGGQTKSVMVFSEVAYRIKLATPYCQGKVSHSFFKATMSTAMYLTLNLPEYFVLYRLP